MSETMPYHHTTAEALEAATQRIAELEAERQPARPPAADAGLTEAQVGALRALAERLTGHRVRHGASCQVVAPMVGRSGDWGDDYEVLGMSDVLIARLATGVLSLLTALAAMTQERDALARRYERRKRAAVEVWGRTLLRLDAAEQSLAEVTVDRNQHRSQAIHLCAKLAEVRGRVKTLEAAITSMAERFLALGHPVESLGAFLTAVDAKVTISPAPRRTEDRPVAGPSYVPADEEYEKAQDAYVKSRRTEVG